MRPSTARFSALPIAVGLVVLSLPGCADRAAPLASETGAAAPVFSAAEATSVLRVPEDFSTLQAAVNAASPGDIIQVAAGTYSENVVVTTSSVRLHAAAGAVLDGAGLVGIGIHVLGTASNPVANVEIDGFLIENFERGIVLEHVRDSRVYRNELRNHNDKSLGVAPFLADGIVLISAQSNEITNNYSHHNGHDGIVLTVGSSGNTVRANLVTDVGAQTGTALGGCGIRLDPGPNVNNEIVENEVLRTSWGIRVGPTETSVGNLIARNRIHDNHRAGIALRTTSHTNMIRENDATGNGMANVAPTLGFDLFDEGVRDNTWRNNRGTSNF